MEEQCSSERAAGGGSPQSWRSKGCAKEVCAKGKGGKGESQGRKEKVVSVEAQEKERGR